MCWNDTVFAWDNFPDPLPQGDRGSHFLAHMLGSVTLENLKWPLRGLNLAHMLGYVG
jgi:hypothetical protein